MLSHGKLSSASDAAAYYQADDYYSESGTAPGRWQGKGASLLSLSGAVDPADFEAVLKGIGPGGEALGQIKSDGKRTPGWDLTFTPSKSVSLLALVAGDERLIAAHDEAVSEALQVAEGIFATTRISKNKEIEQVRTYKLLAATFRHGLSRERDPNLHTHVVIANATRGPDGAWRSLDSRSLYGAHAMISAAYNNCLAARVTALGYEITRNDRNDARMGFGGFEIKGVAADLIETFSKRHDAIERHNEASLHQTPRSRAASALLTRPAKGAARGEQDHENWTAQLGERLPALVEVKQAAEARTVQGEADRTEEAYHFALEHLGDQTHVFKLSDLIATALDHASGAVNVLDLVNRIDADIVDSNLMFDSASPVFQITSREALALEQRMLKLTRKLSRDRGYRGAERVPYEVREGKTRAATAVPLSDEQAQAVKDILTAPIGLQLIQGDAGTGKTSLLKDAALKASVSGTQIIGLGPTHTAVNELGKVLTKTDTVAAYLNGSIPDSEMNGQIVVVDESSMIGTKDMVALLEKFKAAKVDRIIFMGDAKQLEAISAGTAFNQQQSAAHTNFLKEIRRQTDRRLLESVRLASDHKYAEALEHLSAHVIETGTQGLVQAAFAEWQSIKENTGTAPLTLTPTHDRRQELTALIRKDLRATGELSEASINLPVAQSRHLTSAQTRHAEYYKQVDQIAFIEGVPSQGFEKGSAWHVMERNTETNRLTLASPDGVLKTLQLGRSGRPLKLALSARRSLELSKGERVRFTRSIKQDGIAAGQTGVLLGTRKGELVIAMDDDARELQLAPGSRGARALDYAYVLTTHAAQGKTAENVLVMVDTSKRNMLDRKQFYTQISRCRSGLSIIVSDRRALADALKEDGSRLPAYELVERLKTKAVELVRLRKPLEPERVQELPESRETEKVETPSYNDERERERSEPERGGDFER